MFVCVGKTTQKNCVSGPLFACRVSLRHALSGKIRHSQLSSFSSSSILNESYLTFPTFAAIQSLSLCSARCGGGSLSHLGEGGGGGACCRR